MIFCQKTEEAVTDQGDGISQGHGVGKGSSSLSFPRCLWPCRLVGKQKRPSPPRVVHCAFFFLLIQKILGVYVLYQFSAPISMQLFNFFALVTCSTMSSKVAWVFVLFFVLLCFYFMIISVTKQCRGPCHTPYPPAGRYKHITKNYLGCKTAPAPANDKQRRRSTAGGLMRTSTITII